MDADAPGWWPEIPHVRTPVYRRLDADGVAWSSVYRDRDGKPEPLPELTRMPGHVLYGWRDDDEVHIVGDRRGHRWDSIKPRASVFPKSWTDQQIVDAIRDTIESPIYCMPARGKARAVRRTVNGVLIEARWTVDGGSARPESVQAYPMRGKGIRTVRPGRRPGPVKHPHRGDRKFQEVVDRDR